jgi:hypothetical protein
MHKYWFHDYAMTMQLSGQVIARILPLPQQP